MADGTDDATVDLVIFDCDGVLIDSEPLSIGVLLDMVAEHGITIDPEQAYERFLGRSMATITAVLSEEFGVDLTHATLDRMRLRLYELFRRELKPVEGIGRALDGLSRPFCVASSSQPERIRLSLDVTGLLVRLEPHIFSATMVSRGKPAPDLFLHAAREMGAAPEHCVVVEDSPAGIEAAKRAGMRVLCFAGASHAGSEAHRSILRRLEPDLIFDRMETLPEQLARLEGKQEVS